MLLLSLLVVIHLTTQEYFKSNKNFAEIINISGKQRMLSQRLIVLSTKYVKNNKVTTKKRLIDAMSLFKNNHKYIKKRLMTHEQKIFFKRLDKNFQEYVELFENFLKTRKLKYLRKTVKWETKN